jgi:hypothetical protein
MDLEETEAGNDCTGEDQQQFNRPTDEQINIIKSRYKGTNCEGTGCLYVSCTHSGLAEYVNQRDRYGTCSYEL